MVMNFEPQMLATAPGELTSVIVAGEGSPLTFLHGSGPGVSATANWWLNLPSIAQRHCVIALTAPPVPMDTIPLTRSG